MTLDYNLFLNIALALFLLTTILFIFSFIFKVKAVKTTASILFIAGLVSNLASFILRWVLAGHIPMTNTYETIVLFSLLVALIYFVFARHDETKLIACGCSLLISVFIGIASFVNDVPRPLVAALQSNWLTIHVLFCFISYAAFAISFIISIIRLFKKDNFSRMDELIHKNIFFAYTFLVLGIVTGCVWANRAWGSYWSWDPKETWALITLFVYTIYLHSNTIETWKGKKSSYIAVLGFLFIVFTYFGVNYLLSGLHSYS